jgi:hypothetical protein
MNRYYLREGNDRLEEATRCDTKAEAINLYRRNMEELHEYGQEHDAAIHIAENREALQEYPDWVLSRGPRGGVRVERA